MFGYQYQLVEVNGYQLSRAWFDFCFENPELVSPTHTAIYCFAIEHCNRLGWKEKFGFPSQMTMDALGIKKHQTYMKHFADLVEWGFFKLIQKSTNQYSANIICLQSGLAKNGKALDKAFKKHWAKQNESTGQSKVHIDKPLEPINNKPLEPILSTSVDGVPKNDFEKSILGIIQSIKSEQLHTIVKDYKLTPKRIRMIANRKKEFHKAWGSDRDFFKACKYAFEYKSKEWFGTETFKYFEPETLLSEKFVNYLESAEQNKGEPYRPETKKGEDKIVYRIPE